MQVENLIVELINGMTHKMRQYKEELLGKHALAQLTMAQYYYLLTVNKFKDPTYSDIAKELKVSKSTVTVSINKMIEQGYLYRVQNQQDKRVFHIHLTEKGTKLIEAEQKISLDFAKIITAQLTEEETRQFAAILMKSLKVLKD